MNADALFWTTIASAVAGSFAAIGVRALREFSRHELEEICQRRERPDRFSEILRNHESVALATEMLATLTMVLALVGATLWTWNRLALEIGPNAWWTLSGMALAFGLVMVIATIWLPWSIARIGAAAFLYYTWPLWNLIARALHPLVLAAGGVDWLMHRLAGRGSQEPDEESIEEELRTIVNEGHREGLLEEDARVMIEGVIDLGDANVAHIMTPRTEMYMIQVDLPWDEIVEFVIDSGHTRIPVYGKSRDDIVGILYSKDLLPELAKCADEPRRPTCELLRRPLFVAEAKAVDELLQLFQESRTHLAIVLDEFGGVSGLVTIEDVLEEIVGEIADEFDEEVEAEIRKIDDDVCEALGRAHVDDINEMMGFDLPESEDFDTIGGFVFAEFGRVPAVGESLTYQDSVRVTILDATRRRVNRVRLERVRQQSLEIA